MGATPSVLRRQFEPIMRRFGVIACALEVAGRQHVVVDVALTPWQARAAEMVARQRAGAGLLAFVHAGDLPPEPRAVLLPERGIIR